MFSNKLAETTNITKLPTELQIEILTYLTEISDQVALSSTCRLWQDIVSKNQYHLKARYGDRPSPSIPDLHRLFDICIDLLCTARSGFLQTYIFDSFDSGKLDAVFLDDPLLAPGSDYCAALFILGGFKIAGRNYYPSSLFAMATEQLSYEQADFRYFCLSETIYHNDVYSQRDVRDAINFYFKIYSHKHEVLRKWWGMVTMPRGATVKQWMQKAYEEVNTELTRMKIAVDECFEVRFRDKRFDQLIGWGFEVIVIAPKPQKKVVLVVRSLGRSLNFKNVLKRG
ncbi:hypothetical protein H072_1816 [Dactylellina haptotyla CBS 200.50]|uniref:F-box domain-containing protein n=1 Tax=Dactylellina haptotyla (strain CBS 200.50) TaxID=1284197 RepID=S8AT77_DACHA|nr:hypothetical protein H072_1816 [Dactylellina haptotyla CBS 200.50]